MIAPNIDKTIIYLSRINKDVETIYKKVGAVMAYLCGDEYFIKENFKGENMKNLININNVEVEFVVDDNEIFTNSLQVAEVFEKRHDNVLQAIESLPDDDFRRLNFQASSKVRKNGVFEKETKFYNLTRDGFSLLVMGFTGEKAYKFKVAYINAFNRLIDENRLKKPKFQVDKYDFDEFINLFINYGNKYLFESNFIKLKAIKDILDAR